MKRGSAWQTGMAVQVAEVAAVIEQKLRVASSQLESAWRRSPRLVGAIAAGVVAVVVVIALGLHALLTGPSVAGTWVGEHLTTQAGDTPGAVYLNLQQDGDTVSGTGRMCVNRFGEHSTPITVSGRVNGDIVTLTYDFSDAGIPLGFAPVTLGGRLGSTLALTSTAPAGSIALRLHQGDAGAFNTLCAHLPATHG